MSNYIKVFTGNFIEVQRIFRLLEEVNICAIIKDESESGRLAGFGSSILGLQEIHVHKDELTRVKPIIENATSQLEFD
ncbi:putative signal transducing protein [Algibacter sp. R77976]|uniref:putative signal transducing protein n=1 Tax=Algibacter sp. R77976 TaxID=3093873 RepID=UPI0037C8F9FE